MKIILMGFALLPLMSLKQLEPRGWPDPPAPPPFNDPLPMPIITVPDVGPEPVLAAVQMRIRVTACSPHDSPADSAYYAKNGYEGATYGIAADPKVFPRGTLIRVPGYLEKSYPGKFWAVDSKGGSVIRRSTARGVRHIDVKFATLHSVVEWGSKQVEVEVITPATQRKWEAEHAAWRAAVANRDRIIAEAQRLYGVGRLSALQ